MLNGKPIPGTEAYWRQRREAFTFIRSLEKAIKMRNEAPMYIGSPDDPDENTGPWERVATLQDQARGNAMVLETLAAHKRLGLLTA